MNIPKVILRHEKYAPYIRILNEDRIRRTALYAVVPGSSGVHLRLHKTPHLHVRAREVLSPEGRRPASTIGDRHGRSVRRARSEYRQRPGAHSARAAEAPALLEQLYTTLRGFGGLEYASNAR